MLRLAILDIDGCLTSGEGRPWNLAAFTKIQQINQVSRSGKAPAVTLCTGRQGPYVEAFMQAIGSYLPGLFEHGCGLFDPRTYSFHVHPLIGEKQLTALAEVKRRLKKAAVDASLGRFVVGKEYIATLYRQPGVDLEFLTNICRETLADIEEYRVIQASSCVDVIPVGVDKGVGTHWLAELLDLDLSETGGVGDSNCDWSFLQEVGRSATPANGEEQLRSQVQYVSPYRTVEGVLDILEQWCQ